MGLPSIKIPNRCQNHNMMIPKGYESFAKDIKKWISTCVASRTKTVRGVPIEREHELVDRNSSLKSVWGKVRRFSGTGESVIINAGYNLTIDEHQKSRVKSINFSTYIKSPPPPTKKNITPEKAKNTISSLQSQWLPLRTKVNIQIRNRNETQDWVSRMREDAPGWTKIGDAFGRDPMDTKVEARSKIYLKNTLKQALLELDSRESQLQITLRKIKSIESQLFLLMGEKAFKEWFLKETGIFQSPFYPSR